MMSIAGIPYPAHLRLSGITGISGRLIEKKTTLYRYGISDHRWFTQTRSVPLGNSVLSLVKFSL